MPRKVRAEAELLRASADVLYGFQMIRACTNLLMHHGGRTDLTTKNALLESLLIHVRETLEFFYPTEDARKEPDNILACDFFEDGSGWNPPEEGDLKALRRRVNKRLGHLGYSRADIDTTREYVTICNRMMAIIGEFGRAASSKKFDSNVRQLSPIEIVGRQDFAALSTSGAFSSKDIRIG